MKCILAMWLCLVLFMVFSNCKEQRLVNQPAQSRTSPTGLWEGSMDLGAQISLDLVEKNEGDIEGTILLRNRAETDTFQILSGKRTVNDSIQIGGSSRIGRLTLQALLADSVLTGNYFLLIFSPPDEGFWSAHRIK
ncbi:MAG: hypothetical protein ACREOO_05415 [bacterium]